MGPPSRFLSNAVFCRPDGSSDYIGEDAEMPQSRWHVHRKADRSLAPTSSDPFVVATSADTLKPDPSSRKMIRRHVMKGKNRKRIALQPPALGSWINHENAWPESAQRGRGPSDPGPSDPSAPLLGLQMSNSAPSLVGFAVDIEPYMMHLARDFIAVMKRAMYPVERCVDAETESRDWAEGLGHDPEYVRTMVYCAQAYFDALKSQTFGVTAIVYMNKTIVQLQKKLAETDLVVTDSLIFMVLALVMFSDALHDPGTTAKHLHGLYQLISLRGGLAALAQKRSLQFKCCRFDLRFALKTGSKPLFFADNSITWSPFLANHCKGPAEASAHTIPGISDARLTNVWRDLREFTTAINLAHQTQHRLSPGLFQEVVISVQYRLQHLAYDPHDRHEFLRVAMLAFSMIPFDSLDTPLYYRHLAGQVRTVLQSLGEHNSSDELSGLTLWLIFVARVSVLSAPEDYSWLKAQQIQTCGALGLTCWAETRQLLKSFLWLDMASDNAGQSFFCRTGSPGTTDRLKNSD